MGNGGRGNILPIRAKLMRLQYGNRYYCDLCGEFNSKLYSSWQALKDHKAIVHSY